MSAQVVHDSSYRGVIVLDLNFVLEFIVVIITIAIIVVITEIIMIIVNINLVVEEFN